MLKNKILDKKLKEEGYVAVDFFTEEELARLQELYQELHHEMNIQGLFFTNQSPDQEYTRRVRKDLKVIFEPKIEAIFEEMEWVQGIFIVKAPGAGEFRNHQDWSLVDERKYRTYAIWIPLINTDGDNGTICVVKGSHNFYPTRFRSPTMPYAYGSQEIDELAEIKRIPLKLKAGQAAIFDHGIIHATSTNQSDQNRPAAFVAVKPKNTELLHSFFNKEDNKVELIKVEDDFAFGYDMRSRPKGELYEALDYDPFNIQLDEFSKKIKRAEAKSNLVKKIKYRLNGALG